MGDDTGLALLKALRDGDDGVAPLVDWCLEQETPLRVLASLAERLEAARLQVLMRLRHRASYDTAILGLSWWEALGGERVPVRINKALYRLGVERLGDLIGHTPADFLSQKNFGPTSFRQLRALLWDHWGLRLRGDHGEDEETLLKAARVG